MALQSLILPIVSIFRSMGLTQARQGLTAITKDFKTFSKQIGMAAGSFAAFSALTTARQFTIEAVDATQRFERNILALNQVFEDAAPSLMAFTKEVENYGLSQSQAAQASVFLGSVLKQYGFDVNEANAQTQNLVKLAQDLATTFGYDVQEALLAITALFRGEYDPIEKFGVAMKQNEINAVRAARGLGDLTGAAEMQADAQIRLELLFERAGDSMGAFERATNTLYGSQQLLNASLQNLQIAAGAPLQEPLAKINNIFSAIISENGDQIVDVFDELGKTIDLVAPAIKSFGEILSNIVGALQPVVGVLNVFIAIVTKIGTFFGNVFVPVLKLANAIIDDIAVQIEIAALGFRRFKRAVEDSPLGPVIDFFEAAYDSGFGFGTVIDKITEAIKKNTEQYKVMLGIFPEIEDGQRQASAAARETGYEARKAQEELENMAKANQAWTNSWTARAIAYAKQNGLAISEVFKSTFVTGAEAEGTDYVGDFFAGIQDAIAKESARLKLTAMGASEGLIDAILGSQGWEQVFKRVIRDGETGLQRLQREFNKTAAGIDEVTEAAKALEKAQKDALEAAQAAIDDNIADLQNQARAYEEAYKQAKSAADEFRRWTLNNLTTLEVLPDIERQLGKFESAIVSTIADMQSGLQATFRSGLIFESDFNALQRWVSSESAALEQIARQRDELARRSSLSEALISEYQSALTRSLSLTSLFARLKGGVQEIIVTETSSSVRQLGDDLRDFGVTVSRSYTETLEEVQDKTQGLLDGFRDMAQKSRDFAENLRKLRDMGLDPMLFNQLVQAGVEAGGETAQALVDGGSDTITEINTLFDEINQLGAELGYEVSQTMYDSGKDMTYGLLEGIKSQQEALLETARMMAQAFSDEFKSRLDIAVEAPVAAARETMESAQEAVQQAQTANVQAVQTLQDIITKAGIALGGKLSTAFRAGIEEKKGAAEALLTDVLSGQVQDISGIASGITSAEFKAAALRTGGTQVNNYYVTVESNSRTQGAKAGEEIATALQQLSNTSSQYSVSIGG